MNEYMCKCYLCEIIKKNIIKPIATGQKPSRKIYKNVYLKPKKGGIKI